MTGEGNHQYGLKGSLNASWKSDEKISSYGYRMIRRLNHPFRVQGDFVFEHRLVAEKYLLTNENSIEINGVKYLNPEFVVHHIDFDKLNNKISNLYVLPKGVHVKFHNSLKKMIRDPETGRIIDVEKDVGLDPRSEFIQFLKQNNLPLLHLKEFLA